jgi:hypothetical protein
MKTITLPLRNLMNRPPLRAFLLIPFVLACFALSPQARAVCQEGCDLSNGNTFLGDDALILNTTGVDNTAIGSQALLSNTIGSQNTATGTQALLSNTSGGQNTATGEFALFANTTGDSNTAVGFNALYSNTFGRINTAVGRNALWQNTTGEGNTALGNSAMALNTTGIFNTALGEGALLSNTTGNSNIAIGSVAGINLTTGKNNIDIGNSGRPGESAKIRIGNAAHKNTYIQGISGVTVAGGVGVIIDTDGHLGTITSSKRFKDAIKPMGDASETILALKPVTFRYMQELDPNAIPQFGLVAEDVAKVNPDLVARDEEGKPYSVRYEAVNAMLLNEFLKEHKKVEDLEDIVTSLAATVKEQAAQIQKVGAQLEVNKTARQIVLNNQ